jgi:DHA1 family inner membrane transport protein
VLVASAATCGSAALFAASPVIQTRLAAGAGRAATLAFALNGSMVFLGQGAGAAVGGLVSTAAGMELLGVLGALLAAAGLFVALRVTRAVDAQAQAATAGG